MSQYFLNDGTEVTAEQIKQGVAEGKARLVYGNGDNYTTAGVMLDGVDIDTRGQCHSMWDEVWTRPLTLGEETRALITATYNFK